jgi:hypothetical protein
MRYKRLLMSALVPALFFVGVTAAVTQEADAVSGATWTIDLEGLRTHELQTYEVRKMVDEQGKRFSMTMEQDGEAVEYSGVRLSDIVAYIDGTSFEEPWQLDEARWTTGYDVTITASDGYAATFNTSEYGPNDLLFAYQRGEEWLSPRIVGDAPRSLWVKDIVSIEAALGENEAAAARRAYRLEVLVNGETKRFSLAELADSPYYAEGPGRYTTSAGSEYTNEYGGVYFRAFLEEWVALEPNTSVTVTATDGYEMTYTGEQLMNENDGKWLLAFERDGEPLPVDPGYIRVIKIGPNTPNIPGHLAAKMVGTISVSGDAAEDFVLQMRGARDMDLDRSTLQSYMSKEGETVTFTRRGDSNRYTGIPLYKLLAFSDDPDNYPHGQDFSIDPYNADAAESGYQISVVATDGFSVTLDSRDVHENDHVVVAMRKNGEVLPERERPLILVWDEDADPVPEGIRNVRNIETIELDL